MNATCRVDCGHPHLWGGDVHAGADYPRYFGVGQGPVGVPGRRHGYRGSGAGSQPETGGSCNLQGGRPVQGLLRTHGHPALRLCCDHDGGLPDTHRGLRWAVRCRFLPLGQVHHDG